ncbi:hypothetical protein [Parasitella parasitica]|uniref:Uncharacterized protein n=1 Tax=Parasitella parasitica TaxID=35722 RepID=A0A0B7MP27_9FUNG|nr:hypothetical protein [Parasitella parasitica]
MPTRLITTYCHFIMSLQSRIRLTQPVTCPNAYCLAQVSPARALRNHLRYCVPEAAMVVELADADSYVKMGELPDYTDSGMEGVIATVSSPIQAANNEDVPLYAADVADDEPSNDESVQVDDTVKDEDQEASRIRLIDTKYKTSGVVENGSDDLAFVYECTLFKNVGLNSYTKFELI